MEIVKRPKWLSPSSLKLIESSPNTFYLQRLAPEPWPYDKQTPPAAVGSSFDALVKLQLIKEGIGNEAEIRARVLRDIHDEKDRLRLNEAPLRQIMLECGVEPQHREEGLTQGQIILNKYNINGMNSKVKFKDLEIHRHWNLIQYTNTPVPLFMKLDASVIHGEGQGREVPLDWKVTGYGSASGVSPKRGYFCLMDAGINKGAHKEYKPDIRLVDIDEGWALQLCTYGWGLGIPVGVSFVGFIMQVCIRPTGIRFALYKGVLDREYQLGLVKRYVDAWLSVMNGSIMDRVAPTRELAEMAMLSTERWWG